MKKKNKEFWTLEKKARLDNYLKKLEEKGLKEGQDYEIVDGDIIFK